MKKSNQPQPAKGKPAAQQQPFNADDFVTAILPRE